METDGLYNHEQDEDLRHHNDVDDDDDDVDDDDDDDVVDEAGLYTRGLVTQHIKKKKKSGGFQSMGIEDF